MQDLNFNVLVIFKIEIKGHVGCNIESLECENCFST